MNAPMTLDNAMQQIAGMVVAEAPAIAAEATGYGTFIGLPAQVEFSTEGRFGKLLRAITYTGDAGDAWPVPEGAWLDGASIPRAFWSIIGSPYTGKYLSASIVHDHYCIIKERPWRDTHRMFHEAMRCGGVGAFQARVMFYAVYRFGPRWHVGGIAPESPAIVPESADAASILHDVAQIKDQHMSVSDIEAMVDGAG